MKTFAELLKLSRESNVDMHLYVSPAHVYQWEVLDAMGMWESFENWKGALCRVNREVADEYGAAIYPFWDFTSYGPECAVAVPETKDRGVPMINFFDGSHHTPTLGKQVIDIIFGKAHDSSFGHLLDEESLNIALGEIRSDRELWRTRHPEVRKEILGLIGVVDSENSKPQR